MHKTLIIKAFEEALKKLKESGNNDPSKLAIGEELSAYIWENEKFQIGSRMLINYFNKAVEINEKDKDISIKQSKVINGLSHYLGYESYSQFAKGKFGISKRMKRWMIIIVLSLLSLIAILYLTMDGQRWMVWQEDRYVEVEFDQEKMRQGLLKIYKEDRIQHFRKIVPNCNTEFFKKDGSENLWYGKNEDGELEYFTDLAQHPETGKSLDPMTKYMIRKYVCESYR
ncbi:hypothetical protein [Muriicola sp. Z0-33]|uniref:hypothetical protein n=1 Tax=Muriicola sp. Z0-33 TaxID=2816957 RepID=UPI0022386505|nr:hypothetical protein [Muriicola sp. Z0-33]MCW5516914.1 hypothetical protein [Muriicola sp. Z0-33]